MKPQNKHEANNQQAQIDDLPVAQDEAAEVKGGPIYMQIEGVKGDVTASGHEKLIETR